MIAFCAVCLHKIKKKPCQSLKARSQKKSYDDLNSDGQCTEFVARSGGGKVNSTLHGKRRVE